MDNFIVSARKYRPATFASVVGQSHITSTLKNAISRRQLAHAYLFCGPRGVGKTTCARIFAKAINCLNPTADGEACNECESCQAFNEQRSYNIHELDAASNNSVDDIRNLTDQVRIPPQIGRYSVYIIDEVHMLSVQAFNAFLKTLEEPPAHAVFILATTEKHKIIPTILSRCQIYDFNRIRVEDGVEYLKYIASQEGVTYDDESLHLIARKADGGMRDALSMFDKVVSFCGQNLTVAQVAATLNVLDYDTYFTIAEQILAGDYTNALLLFDEVLRKGFSGQTFVAGLNSHFRDLLMCKNPQTLPLLEVTGSVAERYRTQAAQCPVPLLFEGINLLTAVDASLRTATNQRLHVELGLMKLCGLGQKKNDEALTPSLPDLGGSRNVPDGSARQPAPAAATVVPPRDGQPSSALAGTAAEKPDPGRETRKPVSPVPVASPPASAVSQSRPAGKAEPGPSRPAPTTGGVSLSGRSILSLLNTSRPAAPVSGDADPAENPENLPDADEAVEEDVESRLQQGCELLTRELLAERPRLGIAFQDVSIRGNRILLKVPNESLYDEVTNHLTDIRKRLCDLGDVRSTIEFQVEISENKTGLKPIKVEDRLRYLTEKNPLVAKLRRDLDLDIE